MGLIPTIELSELLFPLSRVFSATPRPCSTALSRPRFPISLFCCFLNFAFLVRCSLASSLPGCPAFPVPIISSLPFRTLQLFAFVISCSCPPVLEFPVTCLWPPPFPHNTPFPFLSFPSFSPPVYRAAPPAMASDNTRDSAVSSRVCRSGPLHKPTYLSAPHSIRRCRPLLI